MCNPSLASLARTPGMRYLRPNQNQVAIVIGSQIIPNEPLSPAVQGQCELILAVVMPLKRNSRQPSIEQRPRSIFGSGDMFEIGLHHLDQVVGLYLTDDHPWDSSISIRYTART